MLQRLEHSRSGVAVRERLRDATEFYVRRRKNRVQEIVRLILEAARAEGGDPPGAAFVRSARVVRRALEMAGDLSPASERALADETKPWTPAVEQYCDVLARLVWCRSSTGEPFLEGEGNFGGVCVGYPDNPPAHPLFTTCRIAPRGLEYLADAFGSVAAPDPPPFPPKPNKSKPKKGTGPKRPRK
jgi:hypothetical protein